MKKTICMILVIALFTSFCFSSAVFAEEDPLAARVKIRVPELYNKEVATVEFVDYEYHENTSPASVYKVTLTNGEVEYYGIYVDAVDANVFLTTEPVKKQQDGPTYVSNPGDTEDVATLRRMVDPSNQYGLTITKDQNNYYEVTDGTRTMWFYLDANNQFQQYGWLENIAIFENAGITIGNQGPIENGHPIDPYTGYYDDGVTKCSVYDDVVGSLYPASPYGSTQKPGGSKTPSNSNVDASKNPEQMINFYATGANSYTVTLPTQYSTSVTEDGTTLSGVFSFNLYDVEGDGTFYARLRVLKGKNTEKYWQDVRSGSTDDTHYAQQNAENTLTYYEDLYLVNSDVENAKICYELYKEEFNPRNIVVPTEEPLGLENVVISKQFTTTAADFGPFTESTTLIIALDAYQKGLDNLPHGTYSDILTFQSSIEKG